MKTAVVLCFQFFITIIACAQGEDGTGILAKAKELYAQHDYAAAIPLFDQYLRIDSTNAAVYNLRACATISRASVNDEKNNDTAIRYFSKAITLDSGNYRYYVNRGWALQTMDKYKASLKDFKKALSLDTTNVELYGKVLMNLFVQNRNKEAYALANKIIDKFPGHGYAWYIRGQLKRDYLHKYPEGNKDIKQGELLGWRQGYWLYD